ncbi:MAG TPA: cation:dicarboxylase symporter family transporter [Terracidiphilus sp.]|nr:cation:dicarboxylase symporter family transporter [Terracidiphilus sp.]
MPLRSASRSSAIFAFSVAAALLFAAGLITGLLHTPAEVGVALRWCGFGLFVPFILRRRSLLAWTFFAMLAGAELGVDAPHFAAQTHFLGDIFLRLIRMIVAPLIFGGIVTGIAGHGELRGVGRVALKSIVFFEVATTLGLILGAIAINISQAGVGVTLPASVQPLAPLAHQAGWQDALLNIFPENIAQAVAQNQILQVAIFALLFGTALASMPEPRRAPLVSVLQSLTEAMFRLTKIIMYMAPVAAGAALAYTVGSMGLQTLLPLAKLAVTCYTTLIIFVAFILAPILMLARIPLWRFAVAVAEPAAIGFATTSSEAALPLAMERMEEFGVPRWIVSFVIPTGYSFNLTGSTLYLAMAALFAAQAGGMHLTVMQQVVLLATLALSSKGIAGVPRATLVVLLGVAGSFQIPTAAVLMLLGVDTLMDMGRTGLNVVGNCMAAAIVARWEGELKTTAS